MALRFEDTRYNRQELMPQLGLRQQAALGNASAVSIGAGGVKSTLLLLLAAVGVGRIRVIDHDTVELSNLNRQILYNTAEVGFSKAECAYEKLHALNPDIQVEAFNERVDGSNISDLTSGFDVIIEGGDSLDGRILVNNHCLATRIPMVHASAQHAPMGTCLRSNLGSLRVSSVHSRIYPPVTGGVSPSWVLLPDLRAAWEPRR